MPWGSYLGGGCRRRHGSLFGFFTFLLFESQLLEPRQAFGHRGLLGSRRCRGGHDRWRRRSVFLGGQRYVDPQLAGPDVVHDRLGVLGDDHAAEEVGVVARWRRHVGGDLEDDVFGVFGHVLRSGDGLVRQADQFDLRGSRKVVLLRQVDDHLGFLPLFDGSLLERQREIHLGDAQTGKRGGNHDVAIPGVTSPRTAIFHVFNSAFPAAFIEMNASFCPSAIDTAPLAPIPGGSQSMSILIGRLKALLRRATTFNSDFDPPRTSGTFGSTMADNVERRFIRGRRLEVSRYFRSRKESGSESRTRTIGCWTPLRP